MEEEEGLIRISGRVGVDGSLPRLSGHVVKRAVKAVLSIPASSTRSRDCYAICQVSQLVVLWRPPVRVPRSIE